MPRPLAPGRLVLRRLEQAKTPVLALDGKQAIVFANEALLTWLGLKESDIVGRTCDYRLSVDDPIAAACAALCPPPEAFDGVITSGAVSRLASAQRPFERRGARFVRIEGEESDEHLLMVIVLPAGELAENAASAERLTGEAVHAALVKLRSDLGQRFHISQLLGESEALRRVRQQVQLAADSGARAIVVGPRGSGREHVARTIHFAHGVTAIGSLVPIDCSLVTAEDMQAAVATILRRQQEAPGERSSAALLLDVDRLSTSAQGELAGFLQLPGIHLQTLATARVGLQRLVKRGRFRADLAYALSTLEIVLPALAARRGDIPLLAQHFLEECSRPEKPFSGFHPAAMELIVRLPWPGNLDQLAQGVREACIQASGPSVLPSDLPPWMHLAAHAEQFDSPEEPVELDSFLAEVERELLSRALKRARGNKSRAAQLLGTTRQRLLRRLTHFGLIESGEVEEAVVFHPVDEEPTSREN